MRASTSPRPPIASATVILLAAVFGGSFAADDLVVDRPGGGGGAAGRPQVSAAETDREGPFVVSLVNGDRISGRIVALGDGILRLRPDVAADSDLDLPLARIEQVLHRRAGDPVEPRGDRVYPLAGGEIHGELIRIGPQTLKIDAHLVGRLELPLEAVAGFVRHGQELPYRTAPDEFHEVHSRPAGSVVGAAVFGPRGATVSLDGVSTAVPLQDVRAILFPLPEPRPGGDSPTPARCGVALLNAGRIIGSDPRFGNDQVSVAVAGDGRVAVPLAHLSALDFAVPGAGPGRPRRVIFWSTCADADEEVKHMADALAEGLPKGWKLDAAGEHPKLADLEADLKTAGVLVVPEMEEFNPGKVPPPGDLGRVITAFLDRGGTVVLAGVGTDRVLAYWKATGLVSITSASRASKGRFTFAEKHPLAAGVEEGFDAVNGTYEYKTDDPALVPAAVREGGAAAALSKRAGRGMLLLLGMDYYERSPAVDRVLVNAVTSRR